MVPDPEVETFEGGDPFYYCEPVMGIGEGPIYRASDSTLHWVEPIIEPAEMHILKIDPDSGDAIGKANIIKLEDSVTVGLFRKNRPGSYICAYYQGVAFLDEKTGKLEILKEIIPKDLKPESRFNDGAVDARGRFWLSSVDIPGMAYGIGGLPKDYREPLGKLYRYDPDGSLHQFDQGIICGNGIAWSPDNKTMYHNDSVAQKTYAWDFDLETGNITNKRIFIDRTGTFGEQDGMVADSEGNLWIAVYGSNSVMVYDPTGTLRRRIMFPAYRVTCTTWGGKNHDIIYLTSGEPEGENPNPEDKDGHIFRYKPEGFKGQPKYEFDG